jgi:rhodanese-related sulfurtransferase
MRIVAALCFVGVLLVATVAPAGDPEVPEKYVSVDEAKAMLDAGKRIVFIDVREREQFDDLHILGARNIPLRELPRRLAEVSRQETVTLY